MRENRITEINYSPAVQGFFCCAVFGSVGVGLKIIEWSNFGQTRMHPQLQGRLYDTMSVPALAPLARAIGRGSLNQDGEVIVSLVPPIINEIAEGLNTANGTFDWGDFVAFGVGAVMWRAYDVSAKRLHDSGLTLPVYRALGIKHRLYG